MSTVPSGRSTIPKSIQVDNASRRTATISRNDINKVLADVYGELAEYWHANFRMKHFTHGAYAEYGYLPRSNKYNKRKRAMNKGNSDPLVFSGYSKNASSVHRIAKSRNGARCVMPLVKAFNYKPPNSAIDMRDEFTRTSRREFVTYNRIARTLLRERLKGHKVKIRVNFLGA